jgi:ribonuclease HI
MKEQIILEFDGGSRGNPGPAGVGIVLRAADGTALVALGRYIGRATNNVAEYRALILGLEKARELGAGKLLVQGDSELIIRQMKGEYRVKHPDLQRLHAQAQGLAGQFDSLSYQHRLRHHNALADKLVNLALDRKADVTDVAGDTDAGAAPPAQEGQGEGQGQQWSCSACGCRIEVREPSGVPDKRPFVCTCGQNMRQ